MPGPWDLTSLRGLDGSRVLFELQGPRLPAGFPPLRARTIRPGNLSRPGAPLLGRHDDIALLAALVQTAPLTTIVGPGGMGKTRVANEVAHTVQDRFEDGAWFVDLASVPAGCPVADLASRVGTTLDVGVTGGPAALARAFFARRALIVLDNCEHVLESVAELIEEMLDAAPNVRLLATSRERLGLAVERVVSLDPLSGPTSAELFRVRASEVLPDFDLTPSVRGDVKRICERLDHLPLAIELAARRVTVLAPSDILARLDDRFTLLTGGGRASPERHRTLEATIEWSFSLLSDSEQVMLLRLSVFAGGCTLEAAQAVCGGPPIVPSEVLDLLATLVDRSLVSVDRADNGVRYRLLETVRAFARARLTAMGELGEIRSRHLGWFADVSSAVIDTVMAGSGPLSFIQLARDGANMREAVRWAQDGGDIDLGLRVASGLGFYGFETGTDFRVSQSWIEEFLAAGAAAADASLRVQALYCAANVAMAIQDYDSLARYGEEMLSLVDRHDLSPALRGGAVANLAVSHHDDPPRLLAGMRDAAELLESGGALGLASFAHSWIAEFALEAGEVETAHVAAERALEGARRVGLEVAIARALSRLADVGVREGDLEVAAERATEAEAVARAAGAGSEIGIALLARAGVAYAAGDAPGGAGLLEAAAAQFEQMGFATVPVRIWATVAAGVLGSGDMAAASWCIAHLDEALLSTPSDPGSRRALAVLRSAAEAARTEDLLAPVRDRMPPVEPG